MAPQQIEAERSKPSHAQRQRQIERLVSHGFILYAYESPDSRFATCAIAFNLNPNPQPIPEGNMLGSSKDFALSAAA